MSTRPFISDPSVIIFRDFTIGEEMEATFNLLNTSFGKNMFQYKGFSDEYKTLFEVTYVPPGYIAPGNSAPLKIKFKPKYNSYIKCDMNFLSETGPFSVQVECFPKVINIQIEPFDKLDFGNIVMGEEGELPIVIRNSGALDAEWNLSLEASSSDRNLLPITSAEQVLTFTLKHGNIDGYSRALTRVTFKPVVPCKMEYTLKFTFHSSSNEFETFSKTILICAVGLDVPIYLENSKIDFGVCYYNELYRQTIVCHNRSENAQRFALLMAPEYEPFIEFIPNTGFIQTETPLGIVVKLRTTSKIKQLINDHDSDGPPTITVPVTMEIANQVLPVDFTIQFTPSPNKILLDQQTIDFGTFYTTEEKSMPLKLTSTLEVPVDFGFIRLPPGLSISPFDGYGVINPGETIEVILTFHSKVVKKHAFDVTLITLQGGKFVVKCTADIRESPLQLSSTFVQFEATPVGEESSFSLQLKNTKPTQLDFEFQQPEGFFFDPIVGSIPANGVKAIQILFKPPIPLKANDKPEEELLSTKKSSSKKEKKHSKEHSKKSRRHKEHNILEDIEENSLIDPEFTYKLYEENVACFWKTKQTSGRHHFQMKASSILPTLFVTSVTVNKNTKKNDEFIDLSLRNIDFGIVALGQSIDATVEIRSMSRHPLTLSYEGETGSFEILSPSTEIQPQSTTTLRIRFFPAKQVIFRSKIFVESIQRPNIHITLNCVGQGAAPSISIAMNSIDFGNVMVGHTVTKSVPIINDGSFELQYVYRLAPERDMHYLNSNTQPAFNIMNRSEWLNPDQQGEVAITFTPDHDSMEYENVLVVSAGEDGQTREIPIHAQAWPFQMFVMGGIEEPRIRTAFDHSSLDEPVFRPNIICEMAYPGESAQTTLSIGCCLVGEDGGKSQKGDFSFDNVSVPGFSISTNKGSIEQGTTTQITIEYSPPSNSLLQVGQWVVGETNLNLKCGEFTRKVPVKFKCLINMQQTTEIAGGSKVSGKTASKRKSRK